MHLSVIIPANNEAPLIGACLDAVLASTLEAGCRMQVIVVPNGCRDDTADAARAYADRFRKTGWQLDVIELPAGGKIGALNAGDAASLSPIRVYLDADVTVRANLMADVLSALSVEPARYASGAVRITATGWVSRAYARVWREVPFMRQGVPGCGLFAVNEAGRQRWGDFPDIISDDTFVRLSFEPAERIGVSASYDWPIAEGFANLVKVRRRQDRGVDEIREKFPNLMCNDDKPDFPLGSKLVLALRDPVGFAIYTSVAVISKLTRRRARNWSRGR